MRGVPGKGGIFTSDLSINEFLLVEAADFDLVGLVIGSSGDLEEESESKP